MKILWKRGEIAPVLLWKRGEYFSPVVRFACLGRDKVFTTR